MTESYFVGNIGPSLYKAAIRFYKLAKKLVYPVYLPALKKIKQDGVKQKLVGIKMEGERIEFNLSKRMVSP